MERICVSPRPTDTEIVLSRPGHFRKFTLFIHPNLTSNVNKSDSSSTDRLHYLRFVSSSDSKMIEIKLEPLDIHESLGIRV